MSHEFEIKSLLETVSIYKEHPAMRHQLVSQTLLLQAGGTLEEQELASNITKEFNISEEDFDRVPPFWVTSNLEHMG